MSTINSDDLHASQIQRKLHSKEFILVYKEKANHELWKNDISLIGRINEEGRQEIFDGWAACSHCFTAYRIHSKASGDQTRKNYGLRPFHAHLKECETKENQIRNSIPSSDSTMSPPTIFVQPPINRFAYNKNHLSESLSSKLKDAEVKFVAAGSHSFNALENVYIYKFAGFLPV